MADPLAEWLRAREAADHRARSSALLRQLVGALPPERPLGVLDLGTGRGSNVRYLAPRLPGPQHWLIVDRDAGLLREALAGLADWGAAQEAAVRLETDACEIRGERFACRVEVRAQNLADPGDASLYAGRHLVTASALLDLVSEPWLRALARRTRAAGAAALFTLTYDGESRCEPVEPEDERLRTWLNRHQARDKGLGGPAAGPGATACARRVFVEAGYLVEEAPSPWRLGPESAAMQRLLVEGWADAARDLAPDQAPLIDEWLRRRRAHLDAARSHIVVGHRDLAAWLPEGRTPWA